MPRRTVILRFSDAEFDPSKGGTIAAHQQIIDSEGYTWWGWWKKNSEPFRPDLLEFLQAEISRRGKSGIRIGLVNRKGTESQHVARCLGIRFSSVEKPIYSPSRNRTPAYYRNERFSAWFKLGEIDELSKEEFIREFGYVPFLDPTLYEVYDAGTEGPNSIQILPHPEWTMEPIEVQSPTILHISDLHFGEDHGFPIERRSVRSPSLCEIISNRITRELEISVGIVVVSGDLITRGDANNFVVASDFLNQLLAALGLEKKHLVVIPGNHDIWTKNIDHPTRNYRHEEPYRQFVNGVYGMEFTNLERARRYRSPEGDDLILIELNSARLRSDALKEYGYVSKHRYIDLLHYVDDVLKEDPAPSGRHVLFSVLHHHIIPVSAVEFPEEARPVSLCLDAGELIDSFQEHGIRFVLHGHQHMPFVGMTARIPNTEGKSEPYSFVTRSVFVLGSGSTGVRWERLPKAIGRNTFSIYSVSGSNLDVSIEQFVEGVSPSNYCKLSLPLC